MEAAAIGKPATSEYGAYFGRYIGLVTDPDILQTLEGQLKSTSALLQTISDEKGNHRYEPGKWSVKELIGHIADSERVFAYRALRFARNDATELPGFDQDIFAAHANYAKMPMSEIVRDYTAVRHATLSLFKCLDNESWSRRGIANKNEMTVRALAFTIAGHELHHIAILNSRYLA